MVLTARLNLSPRRLGLVGWRAKPPFDVPAAPSPREDADRVVHAAHHEVGHARRSAVRTAVSSSSTLSDRTARAPAARAVRTPSRTLAAVSPGARPRRFLSSRTMSSSNAPAAIAP